MREEIDFEEGYGCGVGYSRSCEGQGLFALKDFMQGEVVIDYKETSKKWKSVQFKEITGSVKDTCWWIGVSQEEALIASPESLFMRANHNRNPNTEWYTTERTLVAKTYIRAGEEIVFDYRKEIAPPEIKNTPPSWA